MQCLRAGFTKKLRCLPVARALHSSIALQNRRRDETMCGWAWSHSRRATLAVHQIPTRRTCTGQPGEPLANPTAERERENGSSCDSATWTQSRTSLSPTGTPTHEEARCTHMKHNNSNHAKKSKTNRVLTAFGIPQSTAYHEWNRNELHVPARASSKGRTFGHC